MKSYLPFTSECLIQLVNEETTQDHKDALKHAQCIVGLVETLTKQMSADGYTDPLAVANFLEALYSALSGRVRNPLRTTLPVEEWDRLIDRYDNHETGSLQSSLRPAAFGGAESSWVTSSNIRGD